jgi:hypothetical protein
LRSAEEISTAYFEIQFRSPRADFVTGQQRRRKLGPRSAILYQERSAARNSVA